MPFGVWMRVTIPLPFRAAAACGDGRNRISGSGHRNLCWWTRRDSNPQPPACKAGALPLRHSPVHGGSTRLLRFELRPREYNMLPPPTRNRYVPTPARGFPHRKSTRIVEAIVSVAQTGMMGDGKVFVTPAEQAIRIRTKESGAQALRLESGQKEAEMAFAPPEVPLQRDILENSWPSESSLSAASSCIQGLMPDSPATGLIVLPIPTTPLPSGSVQRTA